MYATHTFGRDQIRSISEHGTSSSAESSVQGELECRFESQLLPVFGYPFAANLECLPIDISLLSMIKLYALISSEKNEVPN